MEGGFGAANGVAEKVLGVKLPVFMRVILPGLWVTGVLYPFIAWILGHLPWDSNHSWQRIAAYAALVLILGALISTTNSEIYKIYEGRVGWPDCLFEWARQRQRKRVIRLRKAVKSKKSSNQRRYDEIWSQLRDYPVNDRGEPEATHPTRIGNILAGYEQYPNTRYGMDSVFYWPRIWLQVERDRKEEIDSQWSVADGFLTLSAISFAGSGLWMVQALLAWKNLGRCWLPVGAPGLTMLGGVGWLFFGCFWYWLSLPFHRGNGEVFKSIFDIYREKVWSLTSLRPHEVEMWKATWAYFQYLVLKCPHCETWNDARRDKCKKCDFELQDIKKKLRDSGVFPTG